MLTGDLSFCIDRLLSFTRESQVSVATQNLKTMIDQIRRCFFLLGAVSDDAVADLGLSASTRAVLEHLDENGPATVPQIAAAKTVRRQSIQELADKLHAAGFVAFADNPAHRRSQLLTLTRKGRAVFAEVRERDLQILSRLAKSLGPQRTSAAAATLQALRGALTEIYNQGERHDNA